MLCTVETLMTRFLAPIAITGLLAMMTPVQAADDNATYKVEVSISWSKNTAPLELPNNPHLTQFVGVTHNTRYVLFRDGQTASSGLELVAENGRRKTLDAEFSEAMRRRRVGTVFEGPALSRVPGTIVTQFTTSKKHPLVSMVTMIAPSPDWFTGISDLSLVAKGEWKEEVSASLWAWDAGTDSGKTYNAKNIDTQPQESVRLLATPHFLTNDGLVPIGTIRLTRVRP